MKSGEFRDDKDGGKKLSFRVKKTFKDDGPLGIPQEDWVTIIIFFTLFYGGMACFFSLLYFWNSVNTPIMKSSYISDSRLTLSYSLSYSAKKNSTLCLLTLQSSAWLSPGSSMSHSINMCVPKNYKNLSVTKVLRKLKGGVSSVDCFYDFGDLSTLAN